jgi:NAD(P)-dependent dehydrogenase (short-subunit alcohol dehydrogenase family)
VTLHARNEQRAADARARVPEAAGVLIGDLSSIEAMRSVAEQANAVGRFDAVIHNAGVGYREAHRIETVDGLAHVFAINVLAPYLVTALMTRPDRLVYLSSGMARGGDGDLADRNGRQGAGTARRLTQTASCSTSCWPSGSPDAGMTFGPTPSSRAGWRQRWVARVRPMTCRLLRSPRLGSRSAANRRPA